MATPLKNAYSTSPRAFEVIQKTLTAHKARRISFEYDENGHISAIDFTIEINKAELSFRLPARVKNVEKILYGNYASEAQKQQAYRTAWANIRDWVIAQCAMIDTGMVKVEEVFLPYLLSHNNTTLFEEMEQNQFLQLKEGKS